MVYKQVKPRIELADLIKSFWLIDSESDASIHSEKIIPDGYPELILHFKDPYRINISGIWEQQDKFLIAGQIRNHFFLEKTGESGMIGIKLQPWMLSTLINGEARQLTDKVISFENGKSELLEPIKVIALEISDFESKVKEIENYFLTTFDPARYVSKGQTAVQYTIEHNGTLPIKELVESVDIQERNLERYFNAHIGLSPKYYSRVLKFANIFNIVKEKNFNWSDIAYLAGYYDQSHFIKNFKEFTGEEPSKYGFDKVNMANFFLKK